MSALVAAITLGATALLMTAQPLAVGTWATARARSDVSALRRWRIPLSLLVGLGAWAIVGGPVGVMAAFLLALIAARTLSRARSPGEVRRDRQIQADAPLVAELLAQALASGADVGSSLLAVGDAVGGPWSGILTEPCRALRLGRPAAHVWADLETDPHTSSIGRALARAHETGVPVSSAMTRLAEDQRVQFDLDAQAAVRTIEVRAAVPLGLCFLPAFVLLGVVPLVASVLGGLSVVDGR